MPARETGKQRATRIPLDYFRHADRLERWKNGLALLALLLVLAWAGLGWALSDQHDFHSSRGPVAAVHRSWDRQCSACHVPFTPVSDQAWAATYLDANGETSQLCRRCHQGPEHFAGQKDERSCGSCHREHRGADASLVQLPDSDCVRCHESVQGLAAASAAKREKLVASRFAQGQHPEFSSLNRPRGKLNFSHATHLAPGITRVDAKGNRSAPFLLKDVAEPFRSRYTVAAWQKDRRADAPVQLDCASCHYLDSGDSGAGGLDSFPFSLMGRRTPGAYMQPISYEHQCQACHPLTIDRKDAAAADAGEIAVPHRLQPAQVEEFLENVITAKVVRGKDNILERKTVPLPGKTRDHVGATLAASIQDQLIKAEKDLFLGDRVCARCHLFEGDKMSMPHAIQSRQVGKVRVVPPAIPQVWFAHAKFNHKSHRAVDCRSCHESAKADDKDVMSIPNMKNCVQCHGAASRHGPGVRAHCTVCHHYHNGAHALEGVGAAKRKAPPLTIEDFLAGN